MKEIFPSLHAIRRSALWVGMLVALLVCLPAAARDNRAETRYYTSQDDDQYPQRNDNRNDSRSKSRNQDRQDNSGRGKSTNARRDQDNGRQPSYSGGYYDSRSSYGSSDRNRSRREDSRNSRDDRRVDYRSDERDSRSYNSRDSKPRSYDERYDQRYNGRDDERDDRRYNQNYDPRNDTSVERSGGQRRNDNYGGARVDSATAARAVERATGGRVLSVDQIERSGRVQYRVKVLLQEGRVKTMTVDGQTGAVGG